MGRIKLFTHTDLDGIGCAVVATYAYGAENVDVVYCNYEDVNEKVKTFLEAKDFHGVCDYEKVFITDISVNQEVAGYIDSANKMFGDMITLLDHHKTALFLNEFYWCNVKVENEYGLCCGTSLFFDYLVNIDAIDSFSEYGVKLSDFVEIVRKYDTWEWKKIYNDEIPKMYESLFRIMGKEEFIPTMVSRILDEDTNFGLTELDKTLLRYKQREIDAYIWSKKSHMIKTYFKDYRVGIVFAERYTSELGDAICSTVTDIDFVIMINPSYAVSYRTQKEIDLSIIAKEFGGGGHFFASGNSIPSYLKEKMMNLVLDKENYID